MEHWQYDSQGNLIQKATPAAVHSYVDNGGTGQHELQVTLKTDSGLIHVFGYCGSISGGSSSSSSSAGGCDASPAGQLAYEAIKKGTAVTEIRLREYQYTSRTAGGITVYPVCRETSFRNEDGTGAIDTLYSYTWHQGTVEILERVTALPPCQATRTAPASQR